MSGWLRTLSTRDWLAFLGLTALLVVSQLMGQEAAIGIETCLEQLGLWSASWAAIIFSVILCLVMLGSACLARSDPRPAQWKQLVTGVLAFLAVVLSNAVPGWGFEALGFADAPAVQRVIVFLVLGWTWVALWNWMLPVVQHWFQAPVDLAAGNCQSPPVGPVTLIALVSRIEPAELILDPQQETAELRRRKGDTCVPFPLTFASLAADIENLKESNWPWQQLLRAVGRYAPRPGLKIVLVGSRTGAEDGRGSHEQLMLLCKPLLERYPELHGSTVTVLPRALDFENFNDVKDTIRQVIQEERGNVAEANVFVDITGGQKVASAAAAAATIGTSGQFQYVRTNEPCDVIVSDLHPQTVPAAGH